MVKLLPEFFVHRLRYQQFRGVWFLFLVLMCWFFLFPCVLPWRSAKVFLLYHLTYSLLFPVFLFLHLVSRVPRLHFFFFFKLFHLGPNLVCFFGLFVLFFSCTKTFSFLFFLSSWSSFSSMFLILGTKALHMKLLKSSMSFGYVNFFSLLFNNSYLKKDIVLT